MVFTMFTISSLVGVLAVFAEKTRLMGSNRRDRDLERYAFSNTDRQLLSSACGL